MRLPSLHVLTPALQIAAALWDHVWSSWCADTQAILAALPAALERPMQVRCQPM